LTGLFILLLLAFKIYIIAHAVRTKAPVYWIPLVILMPMGDFLYFLMIISPTIDLPVFRKIFRSRSRSAEALGRYEEVPSLENHLVLAQSYYEECSFEKAEKEFRTIYERYPDNPEALRGMGLSLACMGNYTGAIPFLSRLTELKPSYADYGVWQDLARALWKNGDRQQSCEVVRKLVKISPRMDHELLLAQILEETGQMSEAVEIIGRSLEEYENASNEIRKKFGREYSEMRKLLKKLGKAA